MIHPAQMNLLTELERQDAHLAKLPTGYEFPLFNGRQAVESQRKSGYQSTARAAREIVDNALEAGAKNVWIALRRAGDSGKRSKHQRKNTVTGVAFIDDGPGMRPQMARYALSWGGGTRGDDPSFIGKFGFGLPNSSINQTRRVEVYSRTSGDAPWHMTYLDINEVPQFGLVSIAPAVEKEPPAWVRQHMKSRKIDVGSGTVVVWDQPDRLTYTQATNLKEHLRHDFGVVYRYLLDRLTIHVEDSTVKMVDPLFLHPDSMFYAPAEEGGAIRQNELELTVGFFRDPDTGSPRMQLLKDMEDLEEARAEGHTVSTLEVIVARLPYGFALGEKKHRGTDAYKRYEIRKKRRGMSFVRAGREIETVDAFPRSASDVAAGLGDWPLLQSYAYHWGIELRFRPELDDAFGIGNDKQTVRPVEDLWRVLVAAEVDKAARAENRWQTKERRNDEKRRTIEEVSDPERTNPAAVAAAEAEGLIGAQQLPDERIQEAREVLQEEIERRVTEEGATPDEAKEAIEREAKKKRYGIGFFDSDGGVFFRPTSGNGLQTVAEINKQHPFFESFYARLIELGDPRARQAVDLLLLALARAEMSAEGTKRVAYEHDRKYAWSQFLGTSLRILEQLEHSMEETEEQ